MPFPEEETEAHGIEEEVSPSQEGSEWGIELGYVCTLAGLPSAGPHFPTAISGRGQRDEVEEGRPAGATSRRCPLLQSSAWRGSTPEWGPP